MLYSPVSVGALRRVVWLGARGWVYWVSGGLAVWVVERSVMGDDRLPEIGGELRRLRLGAGLSGVELARRAGVAQATVSRVETGRRVSDAGVVSRLAPAAT
jgi:hypothetical protein